MYPFINEYSKPLRQLGCTAVRMLSVVALVLLLAIAPGVEVSHALSDAQQLVVDSWRFVNQG